MLGMQILLHRFQLMASWALVNHADHLCVCHQILITRPHVTNGGPESLFVSSS